MSYFIDAIEYYLPERVIDNSYLAKECGIDPIFLEQKVGIRERRIAGDQESASDMACAAAQRLFERRKPDVSEIDALIVCTQNPDYRLPTTACMVQHRLGLGTTCMAFDINLGCSGFVYSLAVAGALLESRLAKSALVIMTDLYSRIIDHKDKNTVSLFGDAASAALVKQCEAPCGVVDSLFGTDGSGAPHLMAVNSGTVQDPSRPSYLYMNGREIFKFSVETVPASVRQILARNKLDSRDIKFFVFHQANRYMLTEIQKKLGISSEQMVIDMEMYGNTVSSTVPIAMKNLLERGAIRSGDLLLLCGFGVGLSWGTVLYRQP